MKESDVTESDVEESAELVAVGGVRARVVKLKLAFAVLLNCEFSRPHYIVSKKVFHSKESHFQVAASVLIGPILMLSSP